jgi:two-component system, chemotaxis family, sensor kinase CheA
MSDFNSGAYLGIFLDELDEQLQILDEELLKLERDGSASTVNMIFRAAHTLKGSSAAMGFDKMKDLTHRLENVFDWIRNGQLSVSSELISVIFECVDYLKVLKQAILDGQLEAADIEPYVQKLDGIRVGDAGCKPAGEPILSVQPIEEVSQVKELVIAFEDYQADAVRTALQGGYQVMAIRVQLAESAPMKTIRAMLIHNNIKESGEIIASFPSVQDMEDEDLFTGRFVLILLTRDTEQTIIHNINQISQISSFSIEPITETTLPVLCQGPSLPECGELAAQAAQARNEETKSGQETKVKVAQTVRVDVDRLEHLINLVGELLIDHTRLQEVKSRLTEQLRDQDKSHLLALHDLSNHLNRVIGELQDGMMKTRMLPIDQLFNRFPRMVRDLALKADKEIDFVIEGKETELDRTLIEEISDPIIHILRNAADHGLETPAERVAAGKPRQGRVLLKASHQENHIVITITDDGRGIDPEKIKRVSIEKGLITAADAERMTEKELVFLIFHPGISTAKQVTDLSGRGVGMDIVREHIEKLNGIIDIDTVQGKGTIFTIKLPLTLAIIRSLLVKVGKGTFAVPLANVIEIVRLRKEEVQTIQGQEVCVIRGDVLPLIRMSKKLRMERSEEPKAQQVREERHVVVIVGLAEKRICLLVDRTVGNQEIVMKNLGKFVGALPYLAGATILGGGDVALILDVGSIVREEGSSLHRKDREHLRKGLQSSERELVTFRLRDQSYAVDISRVKEIISVPVITPMVSAPEHMLGMMNLRGHVLPVFDLHRRFGFPPPENGKLTRIMVLETAKQDIGILVDQVSRVLKADETEIEPVPEHMVSSLPGLVQGIYKAKDQFIMLLHLEAVLKDIRVELNAL